MLHPTRLLAAALALGAAAAAFAQNTVVVTGTLTGNVVWTSNNTYILDSKVYVGPGATLTIEAGTVIGGKPKTNPADATALIVARGGRIFALGTAARPITFTAATEDNAIASGLTANDRGRWGGVVLLGNARTNTATGQGNVEGVPTTEPLGVYGGGTNPDDNDNSGIFRYVRILHSGARVTANNELNGLTLGAVGRGTIVEFVEVYANADDGFEWFGGSVDTRFLVSAFNDDDNFDWDEGFTGRGQFWFAIGSSTVGNQALEMDGGTTPETGLPFANPLVYNLTAIGSGTASSNTNSLGLIFRDNTAGRFYNSIITQYRGYAVRIETESGQATDSRARFEAGELDLRNNIWFGFGAGSTPETIAVSANATSGGPAPATNYTATLFTDAARQNNIVDPQLRSVTRQDGTALDPRPAAGSPAFTNARRALPAGDAFFLPSDWIGAFGATNWLYGWSLTGSSFSAPEVARSRSAAINVSTRAFVGTGSNVAIPGFVVNGELPKAVLIRAVGEELAGFGVTGFLVDPTIRVFRSGTAEPIATNNDATASNLPFAALAQVSSRVGAFPLNANTRSSALVLVLNPGAYTVEVSGVSNSTGTAIVEVYDID